MPAEFIKGVLAMRRLGPYLLVDDNNLCGGNVSFRGVYTSKRHSAAKP